MSKFLDAHPRIEGALEVVITVGLWIAAIAAILAVMTLLGELGITCADIVGSGDSGGSYDPSYDTPDNGLCSGGMGC